eukprot:2235266-Prymnesium_polylepis.1
MLSWLAGRLRHGRSAMLVGCRDVLARGGLLSAIACLIDDVGWNAIRVTQPLHLRHGGRSRVRALRLNDWHLPGHSRAGGRG